VSLDTPPGLVGSTVSTTDGTWDNSPTSFTYQWWRNSEGIADATASTYTLTGADADQSIYCVVTAHNAGGQGLAASNNVSPAELHVPVEDTAANISQDGIIYIGTAATWTAANPPATVQAFTLAYDWQESADNVTFASMSPPQTANFITDYSPGTFYRVAVTATNAAGASAPSISNSLEAV
jgi:hypothetical protein